MFRILGSFKRYPSLDHAPHVLLHSLQWFDPTLPGLFADEPPARFAALLDEMAAAVWPESFKTQLSVMTGADLRDILPMIAVPTLLIWGELDTRSPRRASSRRRSPMRSWS